MEVGRNTVVAFRYVMRNGNDDILEDTRQTAPVNYLHGSPGVLPLLQEQLEGLQRGDKKKVVLSKESGAGDDFVFEVVIDDVRVALEEEIVLGYPLHVTVDVCGKDCECYE